MTEKERKKAGEMVKILQDEKRLDYCSGVGATLNRIFMFSIKFSTDFPDFGACRGTLRRWREGDAVSL